jgi:hypothetical protein
MLLQLKTHVKTPFRAYFRQLHWLRLADWRVGAARILLYRLTMLAAEYKY